ncbi:hypothetical protein H0H93_010924, partial [Arthromyces matolae]
DSQGNLQAAIARTLARSAALYFSRPVRLFRPAKVSGWHSLRGLAAEHGTSLSPQYIYTLVKSQGLTVIPKHFIPPMLVNAMLGTILWGTYAEAYAIIEPSMKHYPTLTAGLSGGVAGGIQALLAAPAENVRILLEGGSGGSSWYNAWKEVFQGTKSKSISRRSDIEDIRQLRGWMKEVGDMAGRGWNGWGWGFGKDICGFAAFFSIFEITRRVALQVKDVSQERLDEMDRSSTLKNIPKIIHGLTLVGGGVFAGLAYETCSRPWDVARRIVHLERFSPSHPGRSIVQVLIQKCIDDGILCLFRSPHVPHEESPPHSGLRRRLFVVLRTLGRVEKVVAESLSKATQKAAFITQVFHEGLKSWSCCSDVNKPVLDFEEFMKLPGCTEADRHTDERPKTLPSKAASTTTSSTTTLMVSESEPGKETFSTNISLPSSVSASKSTLEPIKPVEEDDLSVAITPGTRCRRNGCNVTFISDNIHRQGDTEETVCTYHPSPPIFREGSKGYLCCKRRVLEFDEFLKIEGCKTGRHLFSSPKAAPAIEEEESVTCRVDHYQTVNDVHVSIFAKTADKDRSVVEFSETQVKFTIYMAGNKKFSRTLDLFGPIQPKESSYQVFGTKVELHLRKADGRSWTILEKTTQDLGNISLTFGVGGKTGTIGAKDPVLDQINQTRK